MRRRMARTKKKVDPFEFPGSDDESDDDDKLSAKRKRRNSGNSTPHSVNGLDDGGGSTCRDEDGGRSTCRAKLCFPGSGNQSDTAASGTGSSEEGDEGDDEESGRGSSDNDDKIHCKTLGRMATPAKAKLATNSMFEWRQSILDTFWDENEDLGVLRRQIWEENFDWTTAGVDFESPFRFPPSSPSSQHACVCESASLPV